MSLKSTVWRRVRTGKRYFGEAINPTRIFDGAGLQLERDNFPSTLYGRGRVNPTQNLVNAFPMANGYPIDNAQSVVTVLIIRMPTATPG